MKKNVWIRILIGILAVTAVCSATVLTRAWEGKTKAQDLAEFELWPQARIQLNRYLWLFPRDDEANMRMVELLVYDDALPASESASAALQYLGRIRDSSPLAASARLHEAKLLLLILQQPAAAERSCRRAIELNPEDVVAHRFLWTLLDFTGRQHESEEVFWRVYELSPPNERPLRLREWYLSQFAPLVANQALDRMLGILQSDESPSRTSLSRRFLRFRDREPDSSLGYTAVAKWLQEEGDPTFALAMLDAAEKKTDTAAFQVFYLSTLISVLLDLGRFEQAVARLNEWPRGDRGHLYWKWRAIILDDVKRDYAKALTAYDHSLTIWPGPMDWRLLNRRASCFARAGHSQQAAREQALSESVKEVMDPNSHERIRTSLHFLDNPDRLVEVIDFYHKLGREREAKSWEQHVAHLAKVAVNGRSQTD